MFAWCCDNAVGKVTLHGFGKSHTVQAPLVNLKVRVCDDDCDEAVRISLVCAVTELRSVEYDVILPADVVGKLKATPRTVSASCADVSVVSDEGYETPKVDTEKGIPEEVDKSVTGAEFCESGNDVNEVCDVNVEGETPEVVTGRTRRRMYIACLSLV